MYRITETRYGPMLFLENDTVIGKTLELYGEWSQSEMDFLFPYIPHEGICIDIGANIGTHTMFFASCVGPYGKVISFEPQQVIFQLLCANIALNKFRNVSTYPIAIHLSCGYLEFPIQNYALAQNFGVSHALKGDDTTDKYSVPAATLDSFTFSKVDLIKIDVEGSEPEVLLGAQQTLSKHRPLIYAEFHPKHHSQDLVSYLHSIDYDVYLHLANSFNPNNQKCERFDIHNGFRESNIFCVPIEKQIPMSNIEYGLREKSVYKYIKNL